ncbi:MAG: PIN domain-containing protein [Chloroflexi bacterium]|nr:PIN domain-containing protein [Chloroflexota bacterium]MBU1747752.1 PIN domain-containing protein [Chloroflexota bacterium]
MTGPPKPCVLVDADVLFAGAASPSQHGASLVILRMAEITLIEALASEQVITEAERNLADKLPSALPAFRLLVSRCLRIVPDPSPADLAAHVGLADPKDLPILVAARRAGCQWLVTFNVRHYQPGVPDVQVVRPGEFLLRVRDLLIDLATIAANGSAMPE